MLEHRDMCCNILVVYASLHNALYDFLLLLGFLIFLFPFDFYEGSPRKKAGNRTCPLVASAGSRTRACLSLANTTSSSIRRLATCLFLKFSVRSMRALRNKSPKVRYNSAARMFIYCPRRPVYIFPAAVYQPPYIPPPPAGLYMFIMTINT